MNRWLAADPPLIIAHRGASYDAPENTLAAFDEARAQHADGIEFDVQLSADNIPVVIHDETLARTTNGVGRVDALPLSALQQLDAGNGQSIPSLDQVFETYGRNWLYNVEIKVYGWRNRGCEAAVAACIKRHNVGHLVVLSSFDVRVLFRAKRVLSPEVKVALLRDEDYTYTHWMHRGDVDHPHYTFVSAESMADAHKTGKRVHAWTVDDPAEARRLVNLGAHAIITNQPAAIRAALQL